MQKFTLVSALLLGGSVFAGPRVLVIGVDGLKPDCIEPASTPALDRLIANGSFNADGQAEDLTFSGPNWASILHGVHRDKHGVFNNDYRPSRLREWPDFLTRIERFDASRVTAKVIAWKPIAIHQPSEADVVETPENGDEGVTEVAVAMLTGVYPGMSGGPDALFVHLDEVDGAGHTYGFDRSQSDYLRGIERADAMIGRMLDAMEARPGFDREDWLVLVVSDHGGSIDKGHSGNTPEKRAMPFIVSGRGAVRGSHFPQPRTCDVPATVLAHMGVPIDPGWGWDSRVIGLAPTGRPAASLDVNLLYNGDAEENRGFEDRSIDAYALGWNDPGPSQWTVLRRAALPGGAGLPGAGANVFAAGPSEHAAMTQEIDLAPIASSIGAGARYALSGRLWSEGESGDPAVLAVEFVDDSGRVVHRDRLEGAPGAEDPADRSVVGDVPPGARRVVVSLSATRSSTDPGGALADELSLVIRSR